MISIENKGRKRGRIEIVRRKERNKNQIQKCIDQEVKQEKGIKKKKEKKRKRKKN